MGTTTSRRLFTPKPTTDALVIDIGCDDQGTYLCKDKVLPCLNGGVCALFISDVEDRCIERCKCPQDYIGDYCQFYAGFYSATIGLIVGLFVTLLVILLTIIFIWYCCARRKRRKQENQKVERQPPRPCLSNRIDRNNMIYGSNRVMNSSDLTVGSNNPGNSVTPYASHADLASGQIQGYSTSQSFSVYENVAWGEDIDPAKSLLNAPSSVYTYGRGEQVSNLGDVNRIDDKQVSISISDYGGGLLTDRSNTPTSVMPIHR
ncbi:unnamed protein product [Trichobilharzia szidati]|nr:unnamed protein product [Trichobilharzia szidati]